MFSKIYFHWRMKNFPWVVHEENMFVITEKRKFSYREESINYQALESSDYQTFNPRIESNSFLIRPPSTIVTLPIDNLIQKIEMFAFNKGDKSEYVTLFIKLGLSKIWSDDKLRQFLTEYFSTIYKRGFGTWWKKSNLYDWGKVEGIDWKVSIHHNSNAKLILNYFQSRCLIQNQDFRLRPW